MNDDTSDDPQSVAVNQLEHFGLSAYAARTFVALASLGSGTARDVSQASEVPRTRVYDAIEELHDRGLVEVLQSSPKRFWAISAETVSRSFEHDFQQRTEILRRALGELESVERRGEQRGFWTVTGEHAITRSVLEVLAAAEDEIVYMTIADLISEDIVDGLRQAEERNVSIRLAGISEHGRARLRDAIPDATLFDSPWDWSETPTGRFMMVDGRKTLVSALADGEQSNPTRPRSETAFLGEGASNGMVVVLNAIFTGQLETIE